MEYFLLLTLSALATAKVSVQSSASRRILKDHKDVVFFNAGVFMVVAALFLFKVIGCSASVWLFATAFAFLTVAFQLFYTEALSVGNVSLTVMTVNLSMIIPVLVSYFCYNEKLSIYRIIGIILTITTIVCVAEKNGSKINKKWLILTVLASLSNGTTGVTQKIFNTSVYAVEREAFISSSYILAFGLTLIIYFVVCLSNKKKEEKTTKINPRVFIYIALVGGILAGFQWLNNYALTIIDGTFFFPVYSGGSIILSSLVGVMIFKDKLTKKQLFGIILGVVSIVLMNF
jgi:drug/metabolite transporter (DMT)-like permease